ncbi:MAG: hypothetical protein J6032_09190, partial [Bacteroidales bacterium]|nr:hypothetical protein [Bacteroidales bacterium]
TKTQVETGFNVTVDGAKVKSVTPNSNSINLVAGDGVNITNDNGSVKFAINTNGTVAVGDNGLVSGGTVFNEVRVSADGNYIAKDNSTEQNLTALDTAVKTNTDAVSDLQTAVTSLSTGAGITDAAAKNNPMIEKVVDLIAVHNDYFMHRQSYEKSTEDAILSALEKFLK